jgi:F-type H+-transporting ATPase subunit delta
MTSQSNIARPYAQALFELAREQKELAGWNDQLRLLAAVAGDPALSALTNDPHVSSEQLVHLILDVCGEQLKDGAKNLVKLLVRNGRVTAMPDIAEAFAHLKDEAEKVIAAEMVTAAPLDEDQQKQFVDALKTRLGRRVNLEFAVDEELIGGAVIRAGDWVVDGSVKSQLEQLVGALGA